MYYNRHSDEQRNIISEYYYTATSEEDRQKKPQEIIKDVEAFEAELLSQTERLDRFRYREFSDGREFYDYIHQLVDRTIWKDLMKMVEKNHRSWQKVLLIKARRGTDGPRYFEEIEFIAFYREGITSPSELVKAFRDKDTSKSYRTMVKYVRAKNPTLNNNNMFIPDDMLDMFCFSNNDLLTEVDIPQIAIMNLLGLRHRKESTGRKPTYSAEEIREVIRLRNQGNSIRKIERITKISNPTIQKLLCMSEEEIQARESIKKDNGS